MVVPVATHTMLQQPNRPLWACPGSRNLSRLTVLPKPQRQGKRTSGLSVSSSAIADPAALEVLSFDGEARGSERLALKIADPFTAKGLVHRCVVTEKQNARRGTASTLTRAEVRGGGKKPYAQKGTGNARIGSRRTPLRPGGGVSFGPKPTDWTIKINKKERRLAVATALQSAAPDIKVIEDVQGFVTDAKTRVMAQALLKWGVTPGSHALLIVNEMTQSLLLSSRNIPTLKLTSADRLIVSDILRADKVIIESSALQYIQDFLGKETSSVTPDNENEA
ncbi:plastid ribosomal protein L4 large ribosomal subunit [Coccomyxa subellipsoidea C-169]|uniref:Large ribosomal subunit protein uL4c n=1 Tax=Coccomyxa subellipsoidea (strain C-169) TaxID=574566 RepID=I0YNP5_COCSC|nr:plastid ribosomal protein L4 large ribosomal subunit [Coccomyxa subellipsoidea C-169]EIE20014.1 plastid ribosomal protein L4 large ribosomal subunit [Coccomyxa subellipsoidea C-169]|eukprot:XP_005644558.1 plastid ribosomal protein L4 large ribosomal subunit [Coccomyxa subellipsoidea C-169]